MNPVRHKASLASTPAIAAALGDAQAVAARALQRLHSLSAASGAVDPALVAYLGGFVRLRGDGAVC
jgi:hypothetical protein